MYESYDRHLNIFWQYNGNPYLEDNITRAFINTLSLSSKTLQINMINFLISDIEEKIETDNLAEIEIKYDLQNPFIKDISSKKCKKILIGLNPNGLEWGEETYSILKKINIETDLIEEVINNNSKLKHLLKSKDIDENKINENIEYYRYVLNTILERGNSRPDGWIFVFKKNQLEPEIIIAIETKLWSLDPFQLKNHLEKSLGIKETCDKRMKLIKFEEICEKIKFDLNRSSNGIEEHFLKYMELLGYYIKVDEFEKNDILFAIDNDYNRVINNKWVKWFDYYFFSDEYKKFEREVNTKITYDRKKRQLWFEDIKNGNIYFDITSNKNELERESAFFIGTEIGVNSKDYMKKFKDSITKNEKYIEELSIIYTNNSDKKEYESIFSIFKRLNSNQMTQYMGIRDYQQINECLKELKSDDIYRNEIWKNDCLKILGEIKAKNTDYNITSLIEKVDKWKFGEKKSSLYNLLSYLRFVDYVNYNAIYNRNKESISELFSKMLLKHYKGLQYINKLSK